MRHLGILRKAEARNRPRKYRLSLYDGNGAMLYQGSLERFPLPESVILACSEEFFHDPEPCEIHRRAVAQRLYGEMIEALPIGERLAVNALPPRIGLYCREFTPDWIRLDAVAADRCPA